MLLKLIYRGAHPGLRWKEPVGRAMAISQRLQGQGDCTRLHQWQAERGREETNMVEYLTVIAVEWQVARLQLPERSAGSGRRETAILVLVSVAVSAAAQICPRRRLLACPVQACSFDGGSKKSRAHITVRRP